jgi:hypothetical protein
MNGTKWSPALGGADKARSDEATSLFGKKTDMGRIQKEPG